MGHHCCTKQKVKRGLWSPEEDEKLVKHIATYGHGSWSSVPKLAGLERCGKSCRLRWINYLRPDLKRGSFTEQEERIIIDVHRILGNRWAQIAKHLPGRTDNEVKNFWNSCIKKKLLAQGIDPYTHNLILSTTQTNNFNNNTTNNNINACQSPIPHQHSTGTTSPILDIFSSNLINSEIKGSSSSGFLSSLLPCNYNNIPLHEIIFSSSSCALPTSDHHPNPNMFWSSSSITTTAQEQNNNYNNNIHHAPSMESLVSQASTVSSTNPIVISSSSSSLPNPSLFGLIDDNFMWNSGSFEPIKKEGRVQTQVDPVVLLEEEEEKEKVFEELEVVEINKTNDNFREVNSGCVSFDHERSDNFDFDFVESSTTSTVLPCGMYCNNYLSPMDQFAWDC